MTNKFRLVLLIVFVGLLPAFVFAANPFKVGEVVFNVDIEENITISDNQFDVSLKPGETEVHTVKVSNSADVSARVSFSVRTDPQASTDLHFQSPQPIIIDSHSTEDIDFTISASPVAVPRTYTVTVSVFRIETP